MTTATTHILQDELWSAAYRAFRTARNWEADDPGSVAKRSATHEIHIAPNEPCPGCGDNVFRLYTDIRQPEWTEDGLRIATGSLRCFDNAWSGCDAQARRWAVSVTAQGGYAIACINLAGQLATVMAVHAPDIWDLAIRLNANGDTT